MDKDYINIAKNIVENHDLQRFIDILLDYWEETPTSLGHGFFHVLKVAVEAYELGMIHGYAEPEQLFIGGLFHDIYRPAEGIDGGEDQTLGAKITEELFNKHNIGKEIIEKVIGAIKSHDNWIGSENVPQYDLILSVADKISHDTFLTNSYVWSSNKYFMKEHGKHKYNSHLATLYGFVKYQTRAWDLFMKHPLKGVERAIESYIRIYSNTSDEYLKDKEGKNFIKYIEDSAENFRQGEISYLKAFGRSEESIRKITRTYY